jgi:cation diffusion facilitator family transporter
VSLTNRAPEPRAPSSAVPSSRYSDVSRVLTHVLFLNLIVALAKIAFGYLSGAISILSDGFHSLTDTGSNVVGLIGIRAAERPPDEDHPYGHRKYETVAAAAVTIFLFLLVLEVLRNAFNHLSGRTAPPHISIVGFVIMAVTVMINIAVVKYESAAAERLGSEMLLADSLQTRGDVWTSIAVIVALAGARAGMPILDPIHRPGTRADCGGDDTDSERPCRHVGVGYRARGHERAGHSRLPPHPHARVT